ncbi:hypothetical protein Areg01_80710 [Actinoplanes regularis]|nr:hypothetical protein Areg01_80710 [Actinoplanes regularis]
MLTGARISGAKLKITQIWAYSCEASKINLFAPPDDTLTQSNADWDTWSGVDLGSVVDSANTNYGYDPSCRADAIPFDVTSTITDDVRYNKKVQTFALVAASETSTDGWKNFLETSPTLAITYNHKPNKPSKLTTSLSTDCASEKPVGQGPISLYAPVSDPDGGTVGASFKVWKDGTNTVLVDPAKVLDVTSGSTAVVRLNADTLTNNTPAGGAQKFNWAVQATDGLMTSDWTTCSFIYDTTRPGHPDIQQVGLNDAKIGKSIDIPVQPSTDGTAAPTSFLYQFNGGPYGEIDVTTAMKITVTPNRFTNTLTVTSRGASGNIGESSSMTFNATPADTAIDGDLDGDNLTDLVTVGGRNSLAAGVWLAPGKGDGRIAVTATNVGAHGNGVTNPGESGNPTSFNNAQAITGHFAGTGLQDVLVYYPGDPVVGQITGGAVILRGTGDGSAFQTQYGGTFNNIASTSFTATDPTDRKKINNPQQVVNAGPQTGSSYPSLLGIASKSATNSFLTYYPTTGLGGYGLVKPLSNKTPTDGTDWSTWTLASAQTSTGTALFLWQASTGKLYLWNNITYNQSSGMLEGYTTYQLSSSFNTGTELSLSAADINSDGIPDLWTVGDGAAATAWLITDLRDAAGTVTTKPNQKVLTGTHAWMLNDYIAPDADDGDGGTTKVVLNVDTDHPAKDSIHNDSEFLATATRKAVWNTGDMFNPDVAFDGGALETTSSAINTNADFTIDVWAKPTLLGGVVLSQDGTNTEAFRLWADTSTASWRFGLTSKDATNATYTIAAAPNNSVKLGVWTHLTATYTKTTGVLDLHVNGKDVATAVHLAPWLSEGAFRIGAARRNSVIAEYFTGQIAEVVTFNQVVVYDDGNNATRDFDGDNKTDIFARETTGALRLYRGNGATGFGGGFGAIGSGWNNFTYAVTGDFDSDDNLDVIVRNTSGQLYLFRGNGAGVWRNGTNPDLVGSGWNNYTHIVSGDFNHDGNSDLIGRTSTGDLKLFRGTGNKTWQNGTSPDTIGSGLNYNLFYTADFNHDGNSDLIGRNDAGELWLYLGNGNSSWQNGTSPVKIGSSGFNNFSVIFSPGDFSGDGFDDMIVRNSAGDLYLYRGNGANGWKNGSSPNRITTGNFNAFTSIF